MPRPRLSCGHATFPSGLPVVANATQRSPSRRSTARSSGVAGCPRHWHCRVVPITYGTSAPWPAPAHCRRTAGTPSRQKKLGLRYESVPSPATLRRPRHAALRHSGKGSPRRSCRGHRRPQATGRAFANTKRPQSLPAARPTRPAPAAARAGAAGQPAVRQTAAPRNTAMSFSIAPCTGPDAVPTMGDCAHPANGHVARQLSTAMTQRWRRSITARFFNRCGVCKRYRFPDMTQDAPAPQFARLSFGPHIATEPLARCCRPEQRCSPTGSSASRMSFMPFAHCATQSAWAASSPIRFAAAVGSSLLMRRESFHRRIRFKPPACWRWRKGPVLA